MISINIDTGCCYGRKYGVISHCVFLAASSIVIPIKEATVLSPTLYNVNRLSSEYVVYSGILDSEFDSIKDELCLGYQIDERAYLHGCRKEMSSNIPPACPLETLPLL